MSEVRLIDANALKDIEYINKGNFNTVEGIREWIDNAPTVSLQDIYQEGYYDGHLEGYTKAINEERPQGKWIKVTKAGTVPVEYICSLCRRKIYDNYELTTPIDEFYPFCHCGADMQKGGAK